MLYIASALTPTPISHTVKVSGLTSPDATSLVVAKPDKIEVWNVTAHGLEFAADLHLWGTVIGLSTASLPDTRPHLLVLTAPPSAGLHLVAFEDGALVITASEALRPPTPLLRRQEFFTGVISAGALAVASIWTGIVTAFEMEGEKVKDMKRRGSGDDVARRVVFKSSGTHNINIREHNLLDLAFLAPPTAASSGSVLAFLWLSEYNKISVQPRIYANNGFTDLAPATDVVNPLDFPLTRGETPDFEALPFSCPAGRNVLPIGPGVGNTRHFLVIGDEHTVMYEVTSGPDKQHAPSSSPRAASARRTSHSDTGGSHKKRKSSASGRSVATDVENSWVIRPVWRLAQGFGTVLASTVIESHTSGGSVLLGDECGRLTVLGWEFEGESVRVGKVDLGTASPPSALTYLDNGHVFVSSACGDSLLVSLNVPAEARSKGKGKSCGVQTVESADGGAWNIELAFDTRGDTSLHERWMNIAPVKDFVVVEEEDKRVSHLVVASGAGNTNSLRIVRSGVGFDDTLSVEGIAGIERMWTLTGGDHPTLLLSFWSSTTILRLEPDIAPVLASELITSVPTLAAGLINNGSVLVQVTPQSVQLWSDIVAGNSIGAFVAEEGKEIVAASVKADNIVAAFRDGTLIVWKGGCSLEQIMTYKLPREAATVDISADGTRMAAADWNGTITVFECTSSNASSNIQETAYATSLLFVPGKLLAGLSDGTFVAYVLGGSGARTASSLGSRPLTLLPVDVTCGDDTVYAAGVSERLSLLFESHGHTEVSASGKKGIVAAASVTTASLGQCLVLATSDGLCFSRLTSLKKLQVQTLDLGSKSATRLATVPDLKMIAAGTVTQTLAAHTGDIMQVSGVEIRNATNLEELAEFKLPTREAVTAVTSTLLNDKRYIAVGTAVFTSDDVAQEARLDEPASFIQAEKGRLILLEPLLLDGTDDDPRWVLEVVAELDTPAPVRDCVTIHNFLAIASTAKVSILSLELHAEQQEGNPDATVGKLVETAKCTFAFEADFLAVSHAPDGDRLVIGDAMRSILVLDVDERDGYIKWDQRDMSSHSVRALCQVRDDGPGVIISDDHSNLLTFRLKTDIEPAATIGLHEDIRRFRPGAFATMAPDVLRPDLLFATANGRLGIVGELGASATRTLDDLQRNMGAHALGPGGLSWKSFRRAGSLAVPKETRGFIDGDYLQHFLALDPDAMQAALKGASGSTHEQVYKLGEKGPVVASERDVVGLLETVAGMH